MQRLSQTDLVENLQDRRMNRVAPEVAIKILVLLQQRDRNPLTSQ